MEIKGENVGVDLQWAWATRDQVHLPVLIGINPLNQGAVGPTASAYIMGMGTKVHPCQKIEHLLEGPIPYGIVAVGCTTVCRSSSTSELPLVRVCQPALWYGNFLTP
jgi:hypothetical protein